MKKEEEMLQRISALEKEVVDLHSEMKRLKQHVKLDSFEPITEKQAPTPTYIPPTTAQLEPEVAAMQQEPVLKEPMQPAEPIVKKEKRSLEEVFTRALPRIFTVILVLGVLWGLKLVSDYGFLSDSIKIIAGFILSIGLGICAFVMEKKQKGSRIVALSLYGGAFIVGILTTAAGAILYDVLGLYTALIIALIYIVYGVAISYVKGNEALTVLVIFTSLLLPYLLEYMKFSTVIIGLFTVLLFTVVQVVILKHLQRKALYIGMLFSILALIIVTTFHTEQIVFFAAALVVLYSVFITSFLLLYRQESKRNAAMFFSFTIVVLTALNTMLLNKESFLYILLLLLVGMLSFVSYIVYKRAHKILFDIVATLAVLTILFFIAQLNISWDMILLLLILVAFAGLILAVKHAITFMKWVYSFIFTTLAVIALAFCDVRPFISIEHVTQLIVIVMLVLIYLALRQYRVVPANETNSLLTLQHLFPVIIYSAAFIYIWKIDIAYMPAHLATYLMYAAIVITFACLLVLKLNVIGQLLPIISATVYLVAALKLFSSMWVDEQTIMISLFMRLLYIGLTWAILVDLWKRGAIYKNYKTVLESYTEQLTIAGMIISIIALFSLTSFMNSNDLINWSTAVIVNTVSIFVTASLSLFLAAKRNYRNLKLSGIGLLFFGIVKMIFFDLSALDLLIRSISFMIIGAIGLVISNKLLAKGKDEE